jgi:hypothetical protein
MVFPLCFHVLSVLTLDDSDYMTVMGNVKLVPVFGETFPRIFPVVLLVFLLLKAFEVYDKVLRLFGLGEDFGDQQLSRIEEVERGKQVVLEGIKAPISMAESRC